MGKQKVVFWGPSDPLGDEVRWILNCGNKEVIWGYKWLLAMTQTQQHIFTAEKERIAPVNCFYPCSQESATFWEIQRILHGWFCRKGFRGFKRNEATHLVGKQHDTQGSNASQRFCTALPGKSPDPFSFSWHVIILSRQVNKTKIGDRLSVPRIV